MTRPLLPPRGLFTGTRWLFDPALSAPVKETLLQIMALTWGRPGHTTPALSYPQLETITGKPARTLRGHLLALRSYHAALRLQRAGAGEFIIALADWLFTNITPVAPLAFHNSEEFVEDLVDDFSHGRLLPEPVNDQEEEQEEISTGREDFLLPLPDDHDLHAKPKPARAQKIIPGAPKKLTRALEQRLLEAGVFPALLPEVAARAEQWGYSGPQLKRLLEWSAEDEPRQPAALFISRLRSGARIPDRYAKPACPECGKREGHSSDCLRRYTEGF